MQWPISYIVHQTPDRLSNSSKAAVITDQHVNVCLYSHLNKTDILEASLKNSVLMLCCYGDLGMFTKYTCKHCVVVCLNGCYLHSNLTLNSL